MTEDSGERVGLGITVAEDESGYMLITEILENSPLSDSDIKVNDIIVAINDIDVLKDGFDEAVNEMRGNEGTEVTITVRRGGTDIKKTFTRTAIEVITVNGEMLDNYVGYIKVSGFKKNTPDQFISELEELIANGAKAPAGTSYTEDPLVVCKIMGKGSVPFLSAFEVGTSFFNPQSLTNSNFLTFGHNTLDYLKEYPFITVKCAD